MCFSMYMCIVVFDGVPVFVWIHSGISLKKEKKRLEIGVSEISLGPKIHFENESTMCGECGLTVNFKLILSFST